MEKTPEEKRKLSILETDPLSLSLAEFKEGLEDLQSPDRPVIDNTKAADLENKRRLAIHADNNKRSYHRGKQKMQGLAAEIEEMKTFRKELQNEKRLLQEEIQFYNGKAMLRKGETGDWVGTFSGHTGAIWTCDIDSGATRLVTASADYTSCVWDCVTGQRIRTLEHGQVVRGAQMVPESNQIVSLAYKRLRQWDMRDKGCVCEVSTERDVKQLIVCLEYTQLVYTRDETAHISLLEVSTGKCVQTRELLSPPSQLSLSHDGMLLLANQKSGITVLCEYSLDLMREFRITSGSSHSALHPSKEVLVTSHNDNTLYLTEFDSDAILRSYTGPETPRQLSYSPDGEVIAAGTGKDVYLWPNSPDKTYGLWTGKYS